MSMTPLEDLRRRQNLSQEELAKRAAVSKTTIVNIETGKISRPHASTLELLAKALGVRPDRLRRSSRLSFTPGAGPTGRTAKLLAPAGAAPLREQAEMASSERTKLSSQEGEEPDSPAQKPQPSDLFPDHHVAWLDDDWPQDEVGYPDGPPELAKNRPDAETRWLSFEMLANGQLSFHELEALVFVALVQHFRNAADTYGLRPEEYQGRVRAMEQVVKDAECLGRFLWYARDREDTNAFLMLAPPPSEADLAGLEGVLWRWVMVHGSKLREWAGAGPWWDPKFDPMLIIRLIEEVGGIPISRGVKNAAADESQS